MFKKAHDAYGVDIVLKHFPGHGLSRVDSHKGVADVTLLADPAKELKAYKILSKEVDFIMSAHIINANYDPNYPATLSSAYIKPILREQFGFKGKVITDDIIMGAILDSFSIYEAAKLAIKAGCDMIILSFHPFAMGGDKKLPEDFSYVQFLGELTEQCGYNQT